MTKNDSYNKNLVTHKKGNNEYLDSISNFKDKAGFYLKDNGGIKYFRNSERENFIIEEITDEQLKNFFRIIYTDAYNIFIAMIFDKYIRFFVLLIFSFGFSFIILTEWNLIFILPKLLILFILWSIYLNVKSSSQNLLIYLNRDFIEGKDKNRHLEISDTLLSFFGGIIVYLVFLIIANILILFAIENKDIDTLKIFFAIYLLINLILFSGMISSINNFSILNLHIYNNPESKFFILKTKTINLFFESSMISLLPLLFFLF